MDHKHTPAMSSLQMLTVLLQPYAASLSNEGLSTLAVLLSRFEYSSDPIMQTISRQAAERVSTD